MPDPRDEEYHEDHPVAYDDGEWYYDDYYEDEPTEWEIDDDQDER